MGVRGFLGRRRGCGRRIHATGGDGAGAVGRGLGDADGGEMSASLPGAGAAGGLGFGLHCFAGAEIRSGFEIYAEATGLDALLREVDVVVTGEGAMDRQTVMGKGVGELAKRARARMIAVALVWRECWRIALPLRSIWTIAVR